MDRKSLYDLCLENPVSFRSADCVRGGVFFALQGAKVDGHQYLRDAYNHGARYAVIREGYDGETYGLECIRVGDTLTAMQETAAQSVKNHNMRIVAITGSCGKTTTKEYIAAMLATKYDVERSPGTRNSQIGLPAEILNMRKDAELYVFEMGMSKAGEIANLVSIAPPEVAAITMLGRAHLEFFSSFEAIARAKEEIFTSPRTKKKFIGERVATFPFLTIDSEIVPFQHFAELDELPEHFHENASLALAIATYFEVDREKAIQSIQSIRDDRRFSLKKHEGIYWLSDSYNSIPEALLAAIKNLPQKGKRKGAFLSQMAELGEESKKIHAEIAASVVSDLDYLVCYGSDMKIFEEIFLDAGKKVLWFPTRDEAIAGLYQTMQKEDLILVKGSNTQKLWELIPCYS